MDGKVTISPEVVVQVARITTLATPGVLGLVDPSGKPAAERPPRPRAAEPGERDRSRGITASVEDHIARIHLNVIAASDAPLLKLAEHIRDNVANAITEIVGIETTVVHVTFEDVRVKA